MQRAIAITSAKKFYYDTKVKGLKDTNVGKWWKEVKNLAGISDDSGQWYCQLVDGDVIDAVALRGIKIKKAPGPDGLPNVVLKEFAYELGPVISDMYNA